MEALAAVTLPPGFGFHPTDIELISHYLKRKILGLKIDFNVIPEIDIYKHEPWDLPAQCQVPTRDCKWHFFASRDKKYPNGSRSNRTTGAGYWKSTGKDRSIRHQNRVIGTKKTLVFHEGRPPTGKRSDWIMHEYYINENECKAAPIMKDAFVLCRVTKRNGWGLDVENVSEQPENVLAEEVNDCTEEPEIVAPPEVPSMSLGPSESAEDIEAWLSELFDPNFSPTLDVKSEPEEGQSALVLNPEPINSHCPPEISEDSHLQFPVEEFCDVLLSDAQSYDIFEDLGTQYMAAFGDQQVDFFTGSTINDDNTWGLTNSDDDSWGGIQRRENEAVPCPPTLKQKRVRLQTRKMESRNAGEPLSGTIRIDENVRLYTNANTKRGFLQGLRDSFLRCSSASRKCFFLLACVMGTIALIFCFLLRDARRFVGGYSKLEL